MIYVSVDDAGGPPCRTRWSSCTISGDVKSCTTLKTSAKNRLLQNRLSHNATWECGHYWGRIMAPLYSWHGDGESKLVLPANLKPGCQCRCDCPHCEDSDCFANGHHGPCFCSGCYFDDSPSFFRAKASATTSILHGQNLYHFLVVGSWHLYPLPPIPHQRQSGSLMRHVTISVC